MKLAEKLHGTKTERVLQDIKIGLLGLLSLFLIFAAILEFATASTQDVSVTEPLTVSAAPIQKGSGRYTVGIMGEITNTGDDVRVVDALRVTLGRGRKSETVTLAGFLLPPRSSQSVEEMIECTVQYDRIERVEIVCQGQTETLNNAAVLTGSGPVLLYLVLAAVTVLLLIHSAMVRYYMWQERHL